ncbi:MAG: hypothetical protein JW825_07095 [Candidatus Methanofastidiosa archaeon]|nr:hypothetical protein [Candidatus Methanofastidiosa archaeon]
MDDMKRSYSWYKHHAWAALSMLSIFLVFTRFYTELPAAVTASIVGFLCTYAIVAIILTYKHNEENVTVKGDEPPRAGETDYASLDKDMLKAEKKRLKAEAKILKKKYDD